MTHETQLEVGWSWLGRYVAVIVVALILAAAIGSMDLFANTAVIRGKLSAAQLVRFLGYSTALAALWMLGQRSTIALQNNAGRWSFLQHLILPSVSLIVIAAANSVVLLVLKPILNAELHTIYNWVFIIAILACAIWLIMAVLGQSASLTVALTSAAERLSASRKEKSCPECGASNVDTAKFCNKCGNVIEEL